MAEVWSRFSGVMQTNNKNIGRSATAGRFCSKAVAMVVTLASLLCYGCGPRGGRSRVAEENSVVERLQSVDVGNTSKVDTIDFGRVRTGEVVSRTIALHNTSDSPMVVLGTQTSCGCLWLDYDKRSVARGEKMAVEMNFDSAGYTYFVPRTFYITTNLSPEAKKLVVVATME